MIHFDVEKKITCFRLRVISDSKDEKWENKSCRRLREDRLPGFRGARSMGAKGGGGGIKKIGTRAGGKSRRRGGARVDASRAAFTLFNDKLS